MWGAGYGPKALATIGAHADGFILQLADPQILEWTMDAVRAAAAEAGRDPESISICVVAPAYVGDDIEHQREQLRWFGGMVGNHVHDMVKRYGDDDSQVPKVLSDYIKSREGYDYDHHGRAGNPSTDFVPDEIVDRFERKAYGTGAVRDGAGQGAQASTRIDVAARARARFS